MLLDTVATERPAGADDVDVLIVGAGISGIGAGCHLRRRRPQTTFTILEGRDAIGGTWDLFRFPGIRSDSDLHTFGFSFKPWTDDDAIAAAPKIRAYLDEAVDEHGLREAIRFGHQVRSATFDSRTARWTVVAQRTDTGEEVRLTARWLFCGTGYYDYQRGYLPELPGVEDFAGRFVHPQAWPDDVDLHGKRVVVIGSGATAVTLIPAIAPQAAHVTMLQRSPSYVLSLPREDPLAKLADRLLGTHRGYRVTRRKNIALQRGIYRACRRFPRAMTKLLIADVRRRLPKGYDVATHFTPRYRPWDQRLCVVPDGDLFEAISSGKASVVTDHIDRITRDGIRLRSGAQLDADVIVAATGLELRAFGGIELAVDGERVTPGETVAFRGMMLSDVPNFVFALGYTNASWTLKVDLVCEHFCRLLDHLDATGIDLAVPRVADPHLGHVPVLDLTSGYVQRGIARFPKAGDRGSWLVEQAYERDVERLRHGPVTDPELHLSRVEAPASVTV
ncbi:MAG TPA: NAD(P)/FAD-dependent oxidoreductase [Baekduia sp.]|nr:NAD(P)/FAD-dependent oxidoreductase [Baekduia sp.]